MLVKPTDMPAANLTEITSVVNDVDVIGVGISYAFTARS